jgi:5-methylcytosine-specific restriction endonuclease McrA
MPSSKTKFDALRVPCPKCGAYEWRKCVGKADRERKSFHAERHAKVAREKPQPRKGKKMPDDWAATRAKVFALKGSQCVYCGDDASHVDHQLPRARGGSSEISNLVPACAPCNVAKGMMTVEEWRG